MGPSQGGTEPVPVGSLILHATAALSGRSIDATPDDGGYPTQATVRERRTNNKVFYAAIYVSLRTGTYTISTSAQRVEITAGRVTEIVYQGE